MSTPVSSPLILVVDDNAGNQYVACAVLERFGYEARLVGNGEDALDAFSLGAYSLILMDCRMPIMDGYEATMAIRSAESFTGGHIPIIGVTAYAFDGDRERCLAAGMDDCVTKPLTLESVKQVLSRWLPDHPPAE